MKITTETIKDLRERTGAGVLDCRNALKEAEGDIEKAIEILREQGIAKAVKRADRAAEEGVIMSYIHAGGRVGVLLELNCETDFVAHTDQFTDLAHEIALQIAAMKPEYLNPEDIPEPELVSIKKGFLADIDPGKPEHIREKIIEGKLGKYYEEVCLLHQPYIKDDAKTIQDLITEAIAELGENIVIGRFARFSLGGQ